MSSIHFFIAPENFTASPTDFFGPVNTNQYRTTTHFISANNAKAFAICKGHVLITPQIDAGGAEVENVVNVVLKPAEQPLQGLPIKYIIYRGLQLGSFFDDGKVIQTGTDLINKVQADFVSLHGNSGEVIFTEDQLGYFSVGATGWEGGKKLSSAFFKITDSSEPPEQAYELPLVQAGESIGLFIDDTCGIDVVLDYGDYELPASELAFDFNLDFARKATNSIDLTTVSSGAFAQKVTREQIFQFIDIAALYGAAQQQGLSVSSIDAQGNLRTETGDNIFSLITSKFTTKNNWYIYIQSDRQRSYNFYGNYTIGSTTNNLYYGAAANTLAAYSYGTQGWPLLIINSAQNHGNSSYKLYAKLLTDNNKSTRMYVGCGGYDNAEKNNFGTAKTLVNDPTHADYEAGLTQIIELSTAATGSNGNKQPVCSVLSMVYNGVLYKYLAGNINITSGVSENVTAICDWFDDVVDYDGLIPLNEGELDSGVSILNTRPTLSGIHVNNEVVAVLQQQQFIVGDKILDDKNIENKRVTMLKSTSNSNVDYTSFSVSSMTLPVYTKTSNVEESDALNLSSFVKFSAVRLNTDEDEINVVRIENGDNGMANYFMCGVSIDEFDLITQQKTNSGFLRTSLVFLRDMINSDGVSTADDTMKFYQARLGLIGENVNGALEMQPIAPDLYVYSLDYMIWATADYTKWLATMNEEEDFYYETAE